MMAAARPGMRLARAAAVLALWSACWSTVAAGAAPAKSPADYQVLMVSPYGQGLLGVDQYIRIATDSLVRAGLRSDNIHVEYLDLDRHSDPAYREMMRRLMRLKHGGRRIDAVFTLTQPALDFMLHDVPDVAPDAPLLAVRAETAAVPPGRHVVQLAQRFDYDTEFAQALALFPRTRQVLIFIGDIDDDRRELAAMHASLARLAPGLVVSDTSKMTLEQARDRVARLPDDAIVIDFGMRRDRAGRDYAAFETRTMIARAASVPAFQLYDIELGHNGTVGGDVFSVYSDATHAARLAFDIMRGAVEPATPVSQRGFGQMPIYDWAQLRRWGADPDVLPSSTVFVNRPPTLWSQYRPFVLAAGGVFLVLAGLVAALAWQVRRKTRAERAYQRSEVRYRNLVERAPEAIVVYDTESQRIIEHNSKAEQLFGRAREVLCGSTLKELFTSQQQPADALADSIAENTRLALAGQAVIAERTVVRADGTSVICQIWLSRLSDDDDDHRSCKLLRASLVDISARRRAEAALQEYRLDLERLVEERTAALSVALDQARAANRAKSVFLSHMSHEIRTPMNAVLGYAQLLARMPRLDATAHEHAQAIVHSGEHLLGLIDSVLEMSRIEAGNAALALGRVDLGALLRDIRCALAPKAAAKGLEFEVEAAPDLPRVIEADGVKLRQVFLNLVGNAVKYTQRGRVRVQVTARAASGGSLRLAVEVADTGSGIAPAEQARVFEAFEQAQAGQAKGGAGLGMAISRQFARLMGGDVTLQQTGPEGTVLRFTFGARVLHEQDAPAAALRLEEGAAQPRILVVDDVASNRAILKAMLEQAGFRALRELDRGRDVCAVAADWNADLVLLDRRMPDMEGLAVVAALRAQAATRALKVVMVTASVFEEDRRAAFEAGVDGFIGKPLREREVLAEIARLCAGVRLSADTAAPVADAGAGAAPPEPIERALAVRLAELIEAGDALRFERCLAEELRETHPVAYRQLLDLVQKFDYARILALLMPEPA